VEQQEERGREAEIYRLRGVLLLRQAVPQQEEAEAWLRRALDVSRRQEAKALELRAAMSISRLWQQPGKRAEARALLTPVYGWFTEGFDTTDLHEAKALLEELTQISVPMLLTGRIVPAWISYCSKWGYCAKPPPGEG
jgi:predicted ATPase